MVEWSEMIDGMCEAATNRQAGHWAKRQMNRRPRNSSGTPVFLLLRCLGLLLCSIVLIGSSNALPLAPAVQALHVPGGGIQPQVAVDRDGTVHLVYFKGDPAAGDLYYARSKDGLTFSEPLRVNSVPGSAVALGNIRGARLALGRGGLVYVVWNGSGKTGSPEHVPMLYARLTPGRNHFEPERNLIQTAYGLNGGGAVAADRRGDVYVVWHAGFQGQQNEAQRRVWIARSRDDGKTFQTERVAWNEPTGVCGCCSLDAYADEAGKVYILFRSAKDVVHRDMYLLASKDRGATFAGKDISKWDVGYCVMSSEALTQGAAGVLAAWETEKKIHFGFVQPAGTTVRDSVVPGDGKNQKYPALASTSNGSFLVAWTEGMGWKRGGSADWQVFNRAGEPIGQVGKTEGVPAWSLVAAYPRRNGSFVVFY
jgi:hypothetical protein